MPFRVPRIFTRSGSSSFSIKRTPARFTGAPELYDTPRIGHPLSVILDTGGRPVPRLDYQWYCDGIAIPGATESRFTPRPQDDLRVLSCRITAHNALGRSEAETPARMVRHVPPVARVPFLQEIFDKDGGAQSLPAARLFEGEGLRFEARGPEGVHIDPRSGLLTIPTDRVQDGTRIKLVARNSGGEGESELMVAVEGEEAADAPQTPTELRARIEDPQTSIGFQFVDADGNPEDRRCGQYANGDWFVLAGADGPVRIGRMTPDYERHEDVLIAKNGNYVEEFGTRHMNGAMVNPSGTGSTSGFDNQRRYSNSTYDEEANVDPAKTGTALVLETGSVIKSAGRLYETADDVDGPRTRSGIEYFSILTVVETIPPDGSFRPAPAGDDKTATSGLTVAMLDLSKLRALDFSGIGIDSLEDAATHLNRLQCTWVHHVNLLEQSAASRHHSGYGRDWANQNGRALLALHRDTPESQKRAAAIGAVQLGIDFIGRHMLSRETWANGGYNIGFRAPATFAAILLDHPPFKEMIDQSRDNSTWQESQRFRYVPDYMIGEDLEGFDAYSRTQYPYQPAHEGWPEYFQAGLDGGRYGSGAWRRASSHLRESYREIAMAEAGTTLATFLIEGAKHVLNHDAIVQYHDRAWRLRAADRLNNTHGWQDWSHEAWERFRDIIPIPVFHAPEEPEAPELAAQEDTITVTPGAPVGMADPAGATLDIRYAPITADDAAPGGWTVIENAALDSEGRYRITALSPRTAYVVTTRYVADGVAGPWSYWLDPASNEVAEDLRVMTQ